MITPSEDTDNSNLRRRIEAEIKAEGGRIPFIRFMEMALYSPAEGYYTSRTGLVGRDFYTAPHLSSAFGQLIARQLAEFWRRLGEPPTFQIVEMGAGQGLIASDVLTYLCKAEEKLWAGLEYIIVERSEPLKEGQRRRLLAVSNDANLVQKVTWCDLDELEAEAVEGCFFSNELVDAFPVHLIEKNGGKWREIYVQLNSEGQFEEESGPLSTPALNEYFKLSGLDPEKYEEGYRTEINLAALDWLRTVTKILGRGFILTIDYGYKAESRYHPRRKAGTLQTYYRNQAGDNPYLHLGKQDITAHVDFTALIKTGEAMGLKTEDFSSQAAFLGSLGIGEFFSALATPGARNPQEILTERNALQTLINPAGMGNFGVLIQSKNVPSGEKPLTGLSLTL